MYLCCVAVGGEIYLRLQLRCVEKSSRRANSEREGVTGRESIARRCRDRSRNSKQMAI